MICFNRFAEAVAVLVFVGTVFLGIKAMVKNNRPQRRWSEQDEWFV
jgi:hypothetical protein